MAIKFADDSPAGPKVGVSCRVDEFNINYEGKLQINYTKSNGFVRKPAEVAAVCHSVYVSQV